MDKLQAAGYWPGGHNSGGYTTEGDTIPQTAREHARTHVFMRASEALRPALFPVKYTRSVAFWLPTHLSSGATTEADIIGYFFQIAKVQAQKAGARVVDGSVKLIDVYSRPSDGRAARTFSLTVCSGARALSKCGVEHLVARVQSIAEQGLSIAGSTKPMSGACLTRSIS